MRPLGEQGSKLQRDLFVCLLALGGLAPLLWCWPRACLAAAGAWLLLFLTPLPRAGLRRLQARPAAAPRRVAVLAGGFAAGGVLSGRTLRRLAYGLARAEEAGAPPPLIVLCGGARGGGVTEAAAMEREARARGHRGALLQEGRSLTTRENLLALGEMGGMEGAVVITCPQHRPRVARLARALGLAVRVEGYPVEHLPGGLRGRMELAVECFYECAIHVWLSARGGIRCLSSWWRWRG